MDLHRHLLKQIGPVNKKVYIYATVTAVLFTFISGIYMNNMIFHYNDKLKDLNSVIFVQKRIISKNSYELSTIQHNVTKTIKDLIQLTVYNLIFSLFQI